MDETCKNCVELWESIDAVRVIGEASESMDAQQKKLKHWHLIVWMKQAVFG